MAQSAAIKKNPDLYHYFDDSRTPGESVLKVRTGSGEGSVSSKAMARLGKVVETIDYVTSSLTDSTEFGSSRIGSVTILGDGNPVDLFDARRQGASVKSVKQLDAMMVPMMRFTDKPLTSGETDIINLDAKPEAFGTPKLFSSPDPNDTDVAKSSFEDVIGIVDPRVLVDGGYGETVAYPIVQNNLAYLSPDSRNGRIEVFDKTRTYANTLISDGLDSRGAKGSVSGGGLHNLKGTQLITHMIENKQMSQIDFFEDSQDVLFNADTYSLSSGSIGLPGFISDGYYQTVPYDDSVEYTSGSYFDFSQRYALLHGTNIKGPYSKMSEIGTRFKSATCGLQFGESNVLGTDSIAFGGLKK